MFKLNHVNVRSQPNIHIYLNKMLIAAERHN